MSFAAKPLLAALALVAVLAVAAPAVAQQAPTLGAPETQPTTAAPPPVTTSSNDSGGLATWQELLIFGAGIALILGIAFAILGDARERAAKLRHGRPETATAGAPHKHRQQAKDRARAKGKAARRSRRRNR